MDKPADKQQPTKDSKKSETVDVQSGPGGRAAWSMVSSHEMKEDERTKKTRKSKKSETLEEVQTGGTSWEPTGGGWVCPRTGTQPVIWGPPHYHHLENIPENGWWTKTNIQIVLTHNQLCGAHHIITILKCGGFLHEMKTNKKLSLQKEKRYIGRVINMCYPSNQPS